MKTHKVLLEYLPFVGFAIRFTLNWALKNMKIFSTRYSESRVKITHLKFSRRTIDIFPKPGDMCGWSKIDSQKNDGQRIANFEKQFFFPDLQYL